MKTFILIFLTFFSFQITSAQVGALDTTFGVNGNISTPVFSDEFGNRLSVRLPNGQYILFGRIYNNAVSNQVPRFSRFNADGSLDLSFGVNGYLEPIIGISAMQLQTNGKLIAVGGTSNGATIARFNTDGSLDASFGTNGIAGFSGLQGFSSMSIAPDQSIIAGFTTGIVSNSCTFTLCKVLANGSIDSSFGTNGVMVAPAIYSDGTNRQKIYNLNIQQDGKIVVYGYDQHTIAPGNISEQDFLTRYLVNGNLDTTYGTNGIYILPYYTLLSPSQTIQPDDKILIASFGVSGAGQIQLTRYLPNGSVDTSFGTNGTALATIGNSIGIQNILLQPDGKIVLVGDSRNNNNSPFQFLIVRYTSSGLLDTGFNTTGYNLVQRGSNDFSSYFAVHLQDDGKLVAIGQDALHWTTNYMTVFSRFNSGLLEAEGFNKSEVGVYPNPVQNQLSISNEEAMQYELFTVLGAKIQAGSLAVHGQVDCSSLAKGLYLLKLNKDNGESKVVRLVKE